MGAHVNGVHIANIADSVLEAGVLLPIVTRGDTVLDGRIRLRAAPDAVTVDITRRRHTPHDPVTAASLHRALMQHGALFPPPDSISRKSARRVLEVVGYASDMALSRDARSYAALGVGRIRDGEPVNTVLRDVAQRVGGTGVTERYPQLAHVPHGQAVRIAAYLDAFDAPEQRDAEIAALDILTAHSRTDPAQQKAVEVYEHIQRLSEHVDTDRAREITAALSTASAGRALSPTLIERCLDVARQLEETARGIRETIEVT